VLAIDAALGAANQNGTLVQIDEVPSEIAKLAGSQAVTIGNQDGGGITVTVPGVTAGGLLEAIDLLRFQVFPLSIGPILQAPRRDFPYFAGWTGILH
jgi:hypothetical protein